MQHARVGKTLYQELFSTVDLSYTGPTDIINGRQMQKRENIFTSSNKPKGWRIKSPYKQKFSLKRESNFPPAHMDLVQNGPLMQIISSFIGDERLSKAVLVNGSQGYMLRGIDKTGAIITHKHDKNTALGQDFIAGKKNILKALQLIEDGRLHAKGTFSSNKTMLTGYDEKHYSRELNRLQRDRIRHPDSGLVIAF